MSQELLCAIRDTEGWMKHFTRFDYFEAFKKYTATYGPTCMKVLGEADEDAMKKMAGEILDELALDWGKERIWNRSNARFASKQMIIDFFSPMLLGLEEPHCQRFAEILRDEWTARFSKEAYAIATYKQIRAGFRNVIFGLEMKDTLLELEREQEETEKNQK